MNQWFRLRALPTIVITGLLVVTAFAQSDAKGKSHTLHGLVIGIYDAAQSLRISQEKIEGYSEARNATYRVDDPAILKKLQLDDQIVATVYEKDDALYDIRVVRIDDRVIPPEQIQK
jgi:hypothetical protein